ncbi:hypothetical protein B0H16DRAFT_1398800 [Mycena metata]|uniref:Uncharacterized protein n=1 Tax=Mycena metata TaxID=1033252 RepID=A0AAD7DIX0_9AGAR|nr:hypothetical protein B0H16DRAFT_1398800 [Mycena metata]
MSDDNPPPELETEHKAKVTAHLVHHTIIPGKVTVNGAKSKVKPKEKKETKTKEFSHTFEKSKENYLTLLKTILLKHGEEKYNVTEKMTYGIKVQLPSVKKGDSVDIDTASEYEDLVMDILTGRPLKMTIYVDMADIQKRWSGRGNNGSDNDEEDADLYDSNGLSELERELARLRGILEKKYQNDHDAGFTYIDPDTGEAHPLTPQMMKVWCRSMYDGEATASKPPKFKADFNPANRQIALHPARISAGVNMPQAPAAGLSDIAHLAGILTTLVGPLGARTINQQPPPPQTPPKQIQDSVAIPTPSKLPRFLEYASKNLGIPSAPTLESPMRRNAFGPDILHLIDDEELINMGIRKGDAIRLKAGAQSWWNGPEARKRANSETDHQGSGSGSKRIRSPAPATPPSQKVAFERRYNDGGAERFWGPRIIAGEGEKNVYYRCPLRKEFVPVPLGYRATQESEMPESDDEQTELDLLNPPSLQAGDEVDAAESLMQLQRS